MGIKVWCLIASLCLASAKGQANENILQYFQAAESSSPAPPPTSSSDQRPEKLKEIVLYLTPNQVEALEAAGAVVKPFHQADKNDEQQEQEQPQQQPQQQNIEEQSLPQYQNLSPNEEVKQNQDFEEYYRALNVKQINENLPSQRPFVELTTAKPRPKYKYTPKPRQQDYSALYVQKKANRGKSSSTEYVRYLPNYEAQNLKMEPYRAQSLPGYRFSGSQADFEFSRYLQNEVSKAQKQEEAPKSQKTIAIVDYPTRAFTAEPVQVEVQTESSLRTLSNVANKGPVTFEAKLRESTKAWQALKLQGQTWDAPKIWEPAPIVEENTDDIPSPQEVQKISTDNLKQAEQFDKEPATDAALLSQEEIAKQVATLLAPLLQHKKITESIEQQKAELIYSEQQIRAKLQRIKDSGNHDDKSYAIEIDKLNKNLETQNALSQKVALESVSAKNKASALKNEDLKKERPSENIRPAEPVKEDKKPEGTPIVVRIPQPLENNFPKKYSSPLDLLRPIPELKRGQTDSKILEEASKRVPSSDTSNLFVKVDHPFIVQKVVPVEIKHDFPVKHTLHSDKLVIRPIWEH